MNPDLDRHLTAEGREELRRFIDEQTKDDLYEQLLWETKTGVAPDHALL